MNRSYLVLAILLLLLIVVTAVALRRCVFDGGAEPATTPDLASPTPTPLSEGMRARVADAPAQQAVPAQPLPAFGTPTPLPPPGIDGLVLRLSRPVALPVESIRGLAVGDNALYVASAIPGQRVAMLYQLDRDAGTVDQVRDVSQDQYVLLGGLHLSGDTLWAPMADGLVVGGSRGSTLIMALDPATMERRYSFTVADQITMVVQGADGTLFGFDDQAAQVYEWTADGRELQRRPSATGAIYHDGEVVGGALLCAGRDANGGIIDVIDPGSLTIMARRRCREQAVDGTYLTEHGFGFAFDPLPARQDDAGAVFYFLAPGERFPSLTTYVLDDMPLQEWVPLPQ